MRTERERKACTIAVSNGLEREAPKGLGRYGSVRFYLGEGMDEWFDVAFDPNIKGLRVSAGGPLTIAPQVSNVFVVTIPER